MTHTSGMYARVATLPLSVEGYELLPRELAVTRGWTRRTTTVRLLGRGVEGLGEDVTYDSGDQQAFQREGATLPLAGKYTLDGFGRHLDGLELLTRSTRAHTASLYRRWAFESAAFDLALRQAGLSLAAALGVEPRPMRYVVSLSLGHPPSMQPVLRRLALYPGLRFKLDPVPEWSAAFIDELRSAGVVETLDFKGQYFGAFEGTPPDAELYRRLAEAFPHAWLEDPRLTDETRDALAHHVARFAWDAPIHALADLLTLEAAPGAVNVKPSRFGFLSELFRVYEYCAARGWPMYGGGQFELGVGRHQIQRLASLFHPDAPNDVAPAGFHEPVLRPGLPTSPLVLTEQPGF